MSEKKKRILHLDGDIILYRTCASNNEDTDLDKKIIIKKVMLQISNYLKIAKCTEYRFFITASRNFRNFVTDDYKANRRDKERPVNLEWSKEWAVNTLNAEYIMGLEADDLLAIYAEPNAIIWSIDKDIRQIPGTHIDKDRGLVTVSEFGNLKALSNGKMHFDGTLGFYYQCLVGDTADNIIGCAERVETKRLGKTILRRKGVGPKGAYDAIYDALAKAERYEVVGDKALTMVKNRVAAEYDAIFGDDWKEYLEKQANLLYMVREIKEDSLKRWTFDGREEYMNYLTGEINKFPT